jgi:hypothetical protein
MSLLLLLQVAALFALPLQGNRRPPLLQLKQASRGEEAYRFLAFCIASLPRRAPLLHLKQGSRGEEAYRFLAFCIASLPSADPFSAEENKHLYLICFER